MIFGGLRSLVGGMRRREHLMGTDPVRRVNLGAVGCEPRPQLPDGFQRNSTRVGAALGAARTGLSVYELPPGQAVSPYHYEEPEEEWLLVVSGTPTLRHPDGEEQLEPWDLVFFPSGPAGAHLVRNNSESTARVAMFSSSIATVGAVVYPDTEMIWLWTADDAVDIIVDQNSALDDAAPWTARENKVDGQT
jgi:uncharacterized cupin superfamily protein